MERIRNKIHFMTMCSICKVLLLFALCFLAPTGNGAGCALAAVDVDDTHRVGVEASSAAAQSSANVSLSRSSELAELTGPDGTVGLTS